MPESPRGELSLRTLAMPRDANPSGDIFGGWLLSQMDIAAGIRAGQRSGGRVATVAIDAISFKLPVYVGGVLCVYTDILGIGTSSMKIHVEAWALRRERVGSESTHRGALHVRRHRPGPEVAAGPEGVETPTGNAVVPTAACNCSLEVSTLESRAEIPRIRDEDPKLFGSFQLDPVR